MAIIAESEVARRRAAAIVMQHGMRAVEAHASAETFDARTRESVDVVVVWCDRVSGKDVSVLRRLKRGAPSVPVVVVATSIRHSVLADGLAAGLDALVLARDVEVCLGLAVENAMCGQIALPRELSTAVARPTLSVREKQTLALVVMGFSNAEIAQKLFVSESTVKSHLSSAFDRLGVRSRREAAALILDPDRGLGAGILTISGDERHRTRRTA